MLFDLINSLRYGGSIDFADILVGALSALFVIFCTMPMHEYAHALIATKLGDNTAKYQGRLTLNPLQHIDYIGAFMILLVGFGYAKPVPVNMYNLRKPKRNMAFVALAGPIANIIIAFAALILQNIVYVLAYFEVLPVAVATYVVLFFSYIASINVSLAAFNLIPVPPLDGSRILFSVLPNIIYYTVMQYEKYISLALIIAVCTGALDKPIYSLTAFIYSGISYIADLPLQLILNF